MADTALSVIQTALEALKVYPPGQAISGADQFRCLKQLNKMLDQWSNLTLACYANIEQTLALIPGQNQYTIGPGGYANITRPLNILKGEGVAYLVDQNQNRYPMNVIEQDQWNLIGLLTVTSTLPDTIFYDPQFPLGIINIFPTPQTAYNIYFDSRLQLADLPNINTVLSLPPGYIEAIETNLAIRLWKFYKQGEPPIGMVMEAKEAFGDVKRMNIRNSPSTYDSAVVSKSSNTYNIYTDSFRGNS